MQMSRSRHFLYIGVILIGAVFVLTYRGPNWPFVRGFVSDWLIVQLIYLIARFWVSDRWRYHLVVGILLLGVLVEAIQAVSAIPQGLLTDLTIGSTFDPLDVLAYTLGLATVLVVEHFLSRR